MEWVHYEFWLKTDKMINNVEESLETLITKLKTNGGAFNQRDQTSMPLQGIWPHLVTNISSNEGSQPAISFCLVIVPQAMIV